ncbi:hypothetical protein J6590_076239, partial [Homalodisca vitripennis]
PKGVSELDWIKKGFGSIFEKAKAGTTENDYLCFTLDNHRSRNSERWMKINQQEVHCQSYKHTHECKSATTGYTCYNHRSRNSERWMKINHKEVHCQSYKHKHVCKSEITGYTCYNHHSRNSERWMKINHKEVHCQS